MENYDNEIREAKTNTLKRIESYNNLMVANRLCDNNELVVLFKGFRNDEIKWLKKLEQWDKN